MKNYVILPDYHIDALVSWAAERCLGYFWVDRLFNFTDHAAHIARVLHGQNVASVNYLYGDVPGSAYSYTPVCTDHLSAVDILKAADSYAHQAGATDAPLYQDTEAAQAMEILRQTATHELPGYENSEGWCLKKP
jgi:hypothetical protein